MRLVCIECHGPCDTNGCKVDYAHETYEDFEPVTVEERRSMGDDMLYPTHDIFGNWEN